MTRSDSSDLEDEPRILLSDGHRLAAVLTRPAGPIVGSVAVAHPHPAHGGNSDHRVVVATCERAAAAGLVALRFDVRGVRHSDGDVDDGDGHLVDLRVASDAAAEEAVRVAGERTGSAASERAGGASGKRLARLGAGFSYGARLWFEIVRRADAPPVTGLLLLAPSTRIPRTSRDFGDLLLGRPIRDATLDPKALERLAHLPVATQILVGENDVVAPPHEVQRHAGPLASVSVLAGLNHFFSRAVGAGEPALDVLRPALDGAFRRLLSP